MLSNPFQLLFFIGDLIYLFGVYGPSARHFRKGTGCAFTIAPARYCAGYAGLPGMARAAMDLSSSPPGWISPIIPCPTGQVGSASPSFASALVLLWKAYHDLGHNWSPKIDIVEGQVLVTQGIYGMIRHPIYAGLWLWAVALPLLLHNWIAGFAFPLCFLILYLVRMPREEKMLQDEFGQEYLDYMEKTGRIIPRLVR